MVPMSNSWILAQIFRQIFDRLPTDFQQISTIGPIGYFFLPDPPHGKRRGDATSATSAMSAVAATSVTLGFIDFAENDSR